MRHARVGINLLGIEPGDQMPKKKRIQQLDIEQRFMLDCLARIKNDGTRYAFTQLVDQLSRSLEASEKQQG